MKKILFFLIVAVVAFVAMPEPWNIPGCIVVSIAGIASIGL